MLAKLWVSECLACKVFLNYLVMKEKCVSMITTFGESQFCAKENLELRR